jgi:hypothetical protein
MVTIVAALIDRGNERMLQMGEGLERLSPFLLVCMHSIQFVYNKAEDEKCWKRYQEFMARHGSVWGMKKEIKPIITIENAIFDIDVTEIMEAYSRLFNRITPEISGRIVTTPFSMINDDEPFDSRKSTLYYSIYTSNPSVVIAHEIFHVYFEKYTKRNIPHYDTSKEYFTVIMNDVFGKTVSGGYPEHQEIRQQIYDIWKETKSLDACIAVL